MARKTKSSPVLPGLSRSAACSKTKSCQRLDGHRRRCRTTLVRSTAKPSPAPKAAIRNDVVVKGVEVHSADRYEVQPDNEPKARRTVKATKRGPKVLPQCRIAKDGVRCDRLSGHKAHGLRHRFVGIVRILDEVESSRVGIEGPVGTHRNARRTKAAPAGRRDVTIAEALA